MVIESLEKGTRWLDGKVEMTDCFWREEEDILGPAANEIFGFLNFTSEYTEKDREIAVLDSWF